MPQPDVIAYVALGSNLADREARLEAASRALAATPGTQVEAASRVYETAPVGVPGQGPYLNAVLQLRTSLSPRALWQRLQAIEREAGRLREQESVRWGPRCLDLDLLLYAQVCLSEPDLEIPHPRLHERAFVLEPLCELAADLVHPRLGGALCDWAAACRDPAAVWLFETGVELGPPAAR